MAITRKTIIASVVSGLLVILGTAGWWLSEREDPRPMQFVARWAALLGQCQDTESISRLEKTQSEPILIRTFGNGEWVAACSECSCCSGAGFEAAVLRDSRGATRYNTDHQFCGYEGLCGELNRVPAVNLDQFYASLDASGIHMRPWNPSGPQ